MEDGHSLTGALDLRVPTQELSGPPSWGGVMSQLPRAFVGSFKGWWLKGLSWVGILSAVVLQKIALNRLFVEAYTKTHKLERPKPHVHLPWAECRQIQVQKET